MRKYQFIRCLFLLLLPFSVIAQTDLKTTIVLNQIKLIQSGEEGADELYFDISTYNFKGKTSLYTRVPSSPFHWTSEIVDKIQDFPLWSSVLKNGEAMTVVLSLNDADSPPWNIDDVIGIVQLQVKNEDGILKIRSSTPNRGSFNPISSGLTEQKFEFNSIQGHYRVSLEMKAQAI